MLCGQKKLCSASGIFRLWVWTVNTSKYFLHFLCARPRLADGRILLFSTFFWKTHSRAISRTGTERKGQRGQALNSRPLGTWWWLYQPLGFYIGTSELGTKAELESLCKEAENYGIKVIAVSYTHLDVYKRQIIYRQFFAYTNFIRFYSSIIFIIALSKKEKMLLWYY